MNQNARGLRMSRSFLIGVLTYDVTSSFIPEILSGMESELLHTGYSLLLGTYENGRELRERLVQFRKRQIDGVVTICADEGLSRHVEESCKDLPRVFVGCSPGGQGASVMGDGGSLARLAADAFYERGHRVFCHLGSISRPGWHERLEELGVPSSCRIEAHCRNTIEEGERATLRVLAEHPEITAIFADSDTFGATVIKAAFSMGRRVPEDLAVLGVDDTALCRLLTPELASIRQPRREQGELAARLMLEQFQGRPVQNHLLPVELIARQSLGGSIH